MKNYIPFAFLISTAFSFAQQKQHFKAEIDFGGGTVFSTFLDVNASGGKVEITSPKNADVRIMGAKAKLGRAMGKSPKGGIIVTIFADRINDSLIGNTKIPMVGALRFKGIVKGDSISGALLNQDMAIGSVRGVKSDLNKIQYAHLYPKMMQTIARNIYSASVLQTREWKKTSDKLRELFDKAHDDIELFLGFNILAQTLPFSHLSLAITQDQDADETDNGPKSVVFEQKNDHTAYLQIKNFSRSTQELNEILPSIVNNPANRNLIIDLRKNGGGGVEAAFALARHIVTQDTEVGYFVTNKLQYNGFEPEKFRALPAVQPKSTKAFGDDLRTLPGAKLVFKKADNPVFTGKIYVLADGGTGSTCEPIVYALKKDPRVTVIGENTYGGMLAASPFVVSGKYTLMIPIADFYTADGVRLDRVGVAPDIEVKSEDALAKAIELINNENK